MNVSELKAELDNYPDDTIVRFSYDYGDYCHHIIAKEVQFMDMQAVKHSDYVNDFVLDDNEECEFIEDEDISLVLS